jgi:hypothetical protein
VVGGLDREDPIVPGVETHHPHLAIVEGLHHAADHRRINAFDHQPHGRTDIEFHPVDHGPDDRVTSIADGLEIGFATHRPTASLDFRAALKVEELLLSLKERYTIIAVSHSLSQARRLADEALIFRDGSVVQRLSREDLQTPDTLQALLEEIF